MQRILKTLLSRRKSDLLRVVLIASAMIFSINLTITAEISSQRLEEIAKTAQDNKLRITTAEIRMESLEQRVTALEAMRFDARLIRIESFSQAAFFLISLLGVDRLVQVMTARRDRKGAKDESA